MKSLLSHQLAQFNKGDVISINGQEKIVMAVLVGFNQIQTSYNICDTNLLHPQFGVSLEYAKLLDNTTLTQDVLKRVNAFL